MHFWKAALSLDTRLPIHSLHVSLLMGTMFTLGDGGGWPHIGMMGKNLTRCLSFLLSTHPMCLAGSYTEDFQSPSTGSSKATIAVRKWGGNWVRGGEGG